METDYKFVQQCVASAILSTQAAKTLRSKADGLKPQVTGVREYDEYLAARCELERQKLLADAKTCDAEARERWAASTAAYGPRTSVEPYASNQAAAATASHREAEIALEKVQSTQPSEIDRAAHVVREKKKALLSAAGLGLTDSVRQACLVLGLTDKDCEVHQNN